ncbi:hypothetical protein SCHPADRAFT_179908 [Schizopora paradoxa]|uniref:Nephrocystin 3-like N-terminal domain-containing protein n=1 Tax=Schizopora paradoxa TaxID=27342 RepID=A0A0H2RYD7_9AGAM|nr:hypothetical protein SCHPADRAFT_179908 [Schizopora paradoxa]
MSGLRHPNFCNGNILEGETPLCAGRTFNVLLEHIKTWITTWTPGQKHVFWLNGSVGTGKTTICCTIARWAESSGLVVCCSNRWDGFECSSYLPSRASMAQVASLNGSEKLVLSIAWQLADSLPPLFRSKFLRALRSMYPRNLRRGGFKFHHEAHFRTNFRTLFNALIKDPLMGCALSETTTILFILDPHDLYMGDRADVFRRDILETLLEDATSLPFRFLLLLSSRPDPVVQRILGGSDDVIFAAVQDFVTRDDIRAYLEEEFRRLGSPLPCEEWPSENELKTLVEICGTSFAYASSLLEFIEDKRAGDPVEQLRVVLSGELRMSDLKSIWHVYNHFWSSIYQHPTRVMLLGTIAFLRVPLCRKDLSALLHTPIADINDAYSHLQSVVIETTSSSDSKSSNEDSPLEIFHHSFIDLLSEKSGRALPEGFVAIKCLDLVASLPDVQVTNVTKTANGEGTMHVIPEAVNYACVHWIDHLKAFYASIDALGISTVTNGPTIVSAAKNVGNPFGEWLLERRRPRRVSNIPHWCKFSQSNICGEKEIHERSGALATALSSFLRASLLKWLVIMRSLGKLDVATSCLKYVLELVETSAISCGED